MATCDFGTTTATLTFEIPVATCDFDEPTLDEKIKQAEEELAEARADAAETERELAELRAEKARQEAVADEAYRIAFDVAADWWIEYCVDSKIAGGKRRDVYEVPKEGGTLAPRIAKAIREAVAKAKAEQREADAKLADCVWCSPSSDFWRGYGEGRNDAALYIRKQK